MKAVYQFGVRIKFNVRCNRKKRKPSPVEVALSCCFKNRCSMIFRSVACLTWFLLESSGQHVTHHIAYFLVHSRANSVYLSLSVLNILAISGTSGSSGFGSHSKEQMDNSTFDMVSAGDHCDLRMSKQMLPLELMFG